MQSNASDISLNVNENDLSQFSMDLLTISEDVSDIFTSIDSKIESLNSYFSGKQYDKLMNKYRVLRKNYSIVKDTIVSYSDDLICLVNKVRSGDKHIALIIEDATVENLNKAKNVEKI